MSGVISNLRVETLGSVPAATIEDKGRIVLLNGGDLYINKDGVTYSKIIDVTHEETHSIQEVPTGTVNGANTAFTLSATPHSDAGVSLYINGLIQRQTIDYTISGTAITMIVAPEVGKDLYAYYTKD